MRRPRPSRVAFLLALACACFLAEAEDLRSAQAGSPQPSPEPLPGSPAAYAVIVQQYVSGDHRAAVRALRRWSIADIASAVDAISGKRGWLAAGADPRPFAGAVLLHVDAALEARDEMSTAEHDEHERWATRLFQALRDRMPGARPSPREFYLAFASAELFLGNPTRAAILAEDGLREASGDADLLLLAGCAHETLSLAHRQRGERSEADQRLRKAEGHLRSALAVDPDQVETRLRLGRVFSLRGLTVDAERLLQPLVTGPIDASTRYLALLFLGDLDEEHGRPRKAIEAYQAALRVVPAAQTARVALAHALEGQGEPGATALLLAVARAPSSPVRGLDPWWSYPFGPRSLGLEPLGRLREQVREP